MHEPMCDSESITARVTTGLRERTSDSSEGLLSGWRGWWAEVLAPYLTHQMLFLMVASIAIAIIPEYAGNSYPIWHSGSVPLVDASWRWDGQWYWSIAQNGYQMASDGYSNVAFFPLYPLLIRLGTAAFGQSSIALVGALMPRLAFAIALLFVYRLASIELGQDNAARVSFYLALYPAAMFFSAAYPESLFLLFSAAAFYYARRRGFWLAAFCCVVASLTRLQGLLLAIPLIYELYRNGLLRRPNPKLLSLLLVPIGTVIFMAYLWSSFGDPLAFLQAQRAWLRAPAMPYDTVWRAVTMVWVGEPDPTRRVMGTINTLATLVCLGLSIVCLKRYRLSYGLYAAASLLLPLLSPVPDMPTVSMARFAAVVFPCFFVVGELGGLRQVNNIVLGTFGGLFAVLTALFVNWYWVV